VLYLFAADPNSLFAAGATFTVTANFAGGSSPSDRDDDPAVSY